MKADGERGYFSRYVPEDVPEGWDVCNISRICSLQNGAGLPSEERDEGSVPVYGSNGKVGFHKEATTESPAVIVGRKGSAGAINYTNQPSVVIDTAYYADSRHLRCDIRWFFYLLQSLNLEENTEHSAVPGINKRFIEAHRIPLPDKDSQKQIAEFLDSRTNQIDSAISVLNDLHSLLIKREEETRYRLVTSGPQGKEEFSDSGVSWIGDIPNHWNVVRTRFVAELHSGHTPSKSNDEYWEDADIPWVSLADSDRLRHNDYISETEKCTNEKGLANSSAHLLPEGTVVFTRDATVGLCSILERPMAVSQHIVGWVCGSRILPEYLLNVLKSMDQEFDKLTRGSTISTIGMHDIESFKTPLPPLEEQRDIVNHIEAETERLQELIDRVEETMDLLEEKRQALITKAVTGQIDLSDWHPPDEYETTP